MYNVECADLNTQLAGAQGGTNGSFFENTAKAGKAPLP